MVAYPMSHPSEQTLRDFGNGKLDERSVEAINAHLENCPDCQQRVSEMPSDTFLGRLRAAHAQPSVSLNNAAEAQNPNRRAVGTAPDPIATVPPDLADHPDYEVVKELGRGGMGVVFLARNRLMGRDEVLKVVSGHLLERKGILDRFLREIRAAAQLHHPNIVTAYSAFHSGASLVFAMEYVEGVDLARLLELKGPLPVAHACYFIHQAALGLQHAHERGMVHRDIKPGNLMLSRQADRAVVKVLDFGLAKATRENAVEGGLTHEGQMLGTPDFIAPEQIRDAQSADIRADIYSLGCTLYDLLAGKPPFRGASLYDLLQAHHSTDATPLNLIRPEVPTELAALVGKMMAKDAAHRPQTPREVAQALTPYLKRPSVRTPSVPTNPVPVSERDAAASSVAPSDRLDSRPGNRPDEKEPWQTLFESHEPNPPDSPPQPAGPATLATRSRGLSDTGGPSEEQTVESEPETGGASHRRRPRRRGLMAAAGGAAALLFGVVIIINHDHGRTKITVEESDGEQVSVERKQNGPRVQPSPAADLTNWERPPWQQAAAGLEPEPTAQERQAAESALLTEVKKRAPTKNADRTAIARELLDGALEPTVLLPERYARLQLARRLAAEAGAFELACEACDALGRWFAIDTTGLKAQTLEAHARFADTPALHDALACAALGAGFEAIGRDEFHSIDTFVRLARSSAAESGVGALEDQAALLAEDAARCREGFTAIREHVSVLRRDPANPTALTAAGRYLCLDKNDFERGLPMLASGEDPGLRTVARREKEVASDDRAPAQWFAVGDLWWDLASHSDLPAQRCRLRARCWYLWALCRPGQAAPSDVDRARRRLREIPARPFRLRVIGHHVDFHGLRVGLDGVRSTGNYGGWPRFRFNHLRTDTAKTKWLRNHGATRLLPDDVDLTTAEIADYRVTGGEWTNYGKARLYTPEDHAQIEFRHWPSGAFDTEFNLTFTQSTAGKDLAVEPQWTLKFFPWSDALFERSKADREAPFRGQPTLTATVPRLSFEEVNNGWLPNAPGRYFAVEATASLDLPAGMLQIGVLADDGIHVSVDGESVFDEWAHGGHGKRVNVPVTAGRHTIRILYFQTIQEDWLMARLRML